MAFIRTFPGPSTQRDRETSIREVVDIEEEVIMRDKISEEITSTKIISINVAAEEAHVEAELLESFMKIPTSA